MSQYVCLCLCIDHSLSVIVSLMHPTTHVSFLHICLAVYLCVPVRLLLLFVSPSYCIDTPTLLGCPLTHCPKIQDCTEHRFWPVPWSQSYWWKNQFRHFSQSLGWQATLSSHLPTKPCWSSPCHWRANKDWLTASSQLYRLSRVVVCLSSGCELFLGTWRILW